MRRTLTIATLTGLLALGAFAQGRGRGQAPMRSNAPAGTPHASADRDHGRDRAADVGQGKKEGLSKKHRNRGKHKGEKK